ncbi:MAG: tRNA (adenosine(37)-N6)-threonylcarbamoyltransferase complex dimerization subunit type 1 TsaB [Phycisphaerae bacterium]|nr:tRNA (adenosine(37)-N6)-threonylcarbamoyltransferase complex dimerization subunit type 1 TsaB [Phycisphaerae bacterium]
MTEDKIIAIETSGRRGSVALARGPDLVAEYTFPTMREHARELIPTLDRLCREQGWAPADLDQCHLSIGPGSFTGLRVAVTFARHLALAVGARIIAVPTLDVIAENCAAVDAPPPHLAVILDAKRRQVFAAVYERDAGTYRRIVEPCLIEPGRLFAGAPAPIAVIGEGVAYHRDAIDASGVSILDDSLWWPRAANVHRIGWRLAQQGRFTPARELVPFYLRRPEAEELWEKRHGPQPGA